MTSVSDPLLAASIQQQAPGALLAGPTASLLQRPAVTAIPLTTVTEAAADTAANREAGDVFAATEALAGGGAYSHPSLLSTSIQRAGKRVLHVESFGVPLASLLQQYDRSTSPTSAPTVTSSADVGATATVALVPGLIRQVIITVAEVLRFLHARGIVHGSVTPERIHVHHDLVRDVYAVKLGGIESCRFADDAAQAPITVDSPPERCGIPLPSGFSMDAIPNDKLRMLGDVWQLGVVMHQLLFEGKRPVTVAQDGTPEFAANAKGGFFRWDTKRMAASSNAKDLPRLRSVLPKLLNHAGKRLPSWRLDAILTQWSVLHRFGYVSNDEFDRGASGQPSRLEGGHREAPGASRHRRLSSHVDANANEPFTAKGAPSSGLGAATADPGSEPQFSFASLHEAITHSDGAHLGAVVELLQNKRAGHDPARPRSRFNKSTALHAALELQASQQNDVLLPLVEVLLASTREPGALLEVQDNKGMTPLLRALVRRPRDLSLFTTLLDLGHRKGKLSLLANWKMMENAVRHDLTLFVKVLLQYWHDLDFPSVPLLRLLESAAANGAAETCCMLLRTMPHDLRKDAVVRSMLTAAGQSRQLTCEALFKLAADDDDASHADLSEIATAALFGACENNLMDIVEMAVLHRADPLAYNDNGTTAAHAAAAAGFDSSLRTLFTHIPKADAQKLVALVDNDGRTALHLACLHGQGPCVSILLDSGADPNSSDPERWTPLHLAAMKGWGGICNALIGWNAWANPTLADGSTPTLLAAAAGEIECIRDALLPNGCALASEYEVHYRTAYDELLLLLQRATDNLNTLDTYDSRALLFVLALVYPLCVVAAAVGIVVSNDGGLNWPTVGFSCAAFVLHCCAMLTAHENISAAHKETQEFQDSLLPVRTVLKSMSGSVPEHTADAVENAVHRFNEQLQALEAAMQKPVDVGEADHAKRQLALTKKFARKLHRWVERLPRTAGGQNQKFTSMSVDTSDGLKFVDEHVRQAVDPVRQLALRQFVHGVLSKSESDLDVLSLASPFISRELFMNHARALLSAHGELLTLRVASLVVMIIIFSTLATILFTKEGAVAFHFSNLLAEQCADASAIRCTDFMTSNEWLGLSNPDCCFGATPVDCVCPGNISSLLQPVTQAPPTATLAANGTSASGPTTVPLVPEDAHRVIYLRSGAHDTTYPTTRLTVRACRLREPRPEFIVDTLLNEGRVTNAANVAGSVFLILGGFAMMVGQIAVASRWVRRRTVTYQLSGYGTFQASLARFYLLASLHSVVATLCFVLATHRLQGTSVEDVEDLGVAIGLLSTYPGLAIVTWLPKIGYIVAPILRQAYLGLMFVLGMIVTFPIIPAINSFAIPFFVTDPQRAIVSFSSATSSRTFYVAICVFWVLLFFRLFVAAAGALAPADARAHYMEFFRESRLLVAQQLPSRRGAIDAGIVAAGDDDDGAFNYSTGGMQLPAAVGGDANKTPSNGTYPDSSDEDIDGSSVMLTSDRTPSRHASPNMGPQQRAEGPPLPTLGESQKLRTRPSLLQKRSPFGALHQSQRRATASLQRHASPDTPVPTSIGTSSRTPPVANVSLARRPASHTTPVRREHPPLVAAVDALTPTASLVSNALATSVLVAQPETVVDASAARRDGAAMPDVLLET